MSVLVCRICHRSKVDDRWENYGGVEADHVGICPTCLAWQTRVQHAKMRREERKFEAQLPDDPFKGFRT